MKGLKQLKRHRANGALLYVCVTKPPKVFEASVLQGEKVDLRAGIRQGYNGRDTTFREGDDSLCVGM